MPASIANIPIRAYARGSRPMAVAIGAKIGTVKSIIETESTIIPRTNHTSTIIVTTCHGSKPASAKKVWMALTTPVIVNVREYN